MNDSSNQIRTWLATDGETRRKAVVEASRHLLQRYLQRWRHLIPVELHRLASTLNADIVRLRDMEGEAVLMPRQGGFQILLSAQVPTGRYRTSVAHELAHTLFYSDPGGGEPRRFVNHSIREEHFCFDVSRHILAPEEHIEAIGIRKGEDPAEMFTKLTRRLLLSRPWAARLMLADYIFAKGIGGRWIRTKGKWIQEAGSAVATPTLKQRERMQLRALATKYLECPVAASPGCKIFAVPEKSGEGVFVIVTVE